VHNVEASVELQPVDVGVNATVSLVTTVPPGFVVIVMVMLAVAGETYAGERCALVVPVFGIVMVKRTIPPLVLPPAPDDDACGTDELAPPPAQPAMSAAASNKTKRYLRYIMMRLH
jgi:hypothetical protein